MADEKSMQDEEQEVSEEVIDPPDIDSKYRMIILAAQRSKQLQRGAHSRTEIDTRKSKPTRVAMRELEERRVNFSFVEQVNPNGEESEQSE